MLREKIRNRENGIVLYGITPPKKETTSEKIVQIAERQVKRIAPLGIDGLILYDIQDEATRTEEKRPFPFIETCDALTYSSQYLASLPTQKILYRAVGKYSNDQLTSFLTSPQMENNLAVFVGASSKDQAVQLSLAEAYRLKNELNAALPTPPVGGVIIPERHDNRDEHLRVFKKIAQGCSFFVSQCVYDVNASKNFLSDYYYYGLEHNQTLAPIIFTFTPCGSLKTLDFMKWLGIRIPKWMENELIHSNDILERSVEFAEQSWLEIQEFAEKKQIPIGCNIESVAVRKVEIEASIELLTRVKKSIKK